MSLNSDKYFDEISVKPSFQIKIFKKELKNQDLQKFDKFVS